MNWLKRTFGSKKQEVRGKKMEDGVVSSHLSPLTSYSTIHKTPTPFRAGLLLIFFASTLWLGVEVARTAAGSEWYQRGWSTHSTDPDTTTHTDTAEDSSPAAWDKYNTKDQAIVAAGTITLSNAAPLTAFQTSDDNNPVLDTCGSSGCAMPAGFGDADAVKTSTVVSGTDAAAQVILSGGGPYTSSGTYESDAIDLGSTNYSLTTLSWNATVPALAKGAGTVISDSTTGLVGLWHLDSTSGTTATDAVGGDQNGTLYYFDNTASVDADSNSGWTASSKLNFTRALKLASDGSDDYVDLGDTAALEITNNITVEAWTYIDTTTAMNDPAYIVYGAGGYALKFSTATDVVQAYFNFAAGGSPTLSTNITTGWHHLAMTFSGGTAYALYVDGAKTASGTVGTTTLNYTASTKTIIGGSPASGTGSGACTICDEASATLEGKIDEVAIYSRALATDEIKAHYASFRLQLGYDNDGTPGSPFTWVYMGPDGTASTYFTQPMALWHFNENTGSPTYDASGNGNTGTLTPGDNTGSNDTVADMWETTNKKPSLGTSAIEFDGTNDYVTVADSPSLKLSSQFSVEAWVYPQVLSADRVIVAKQNEYLLRYTNSLGKLSFYLYDGTDWEASAHSTTSPSINNWYHVVGTWDGTNQRIYVNGVLEHSVSHSFTPAPTTNALTIGQWNGAGFFAGAIDEVAIYDRTLIGPASGESCTTQPNNEICARYNSGSGREGAVWDTSGLNTLDAKRYLNYKAFYGTSDTSRTPQLDDITLGYLGYPGTDTTLTSSKYNTGTTANFIKQIIWTENNTSQAGTPSGTVKLLLGSAPDSTTTPTFTTFTFADASGGTCPSGVCTVTIPTSNAVADADNDQWFQYKASLASTGALSPSVDDIKIIYETAHLDVQKEGETDNSYTPTAGTAFNITITAKDSGNNTVSGHGGGTRTVRVDASGSPSDKGSCTAGFKLSGDPSYAAFGTTKNLTFSGGTHSDTVNVRLCDATQTTTISATETVLGSLTTIASSDLEIPAITATADHFEVTTANGTPVAGTAFNVTLTAKDTYGNTVTNYSASGKTFTLSGPGNAPDSTAPLYPSNASIISAFTNGAATISVTLYKVETVSIDVSDGTLNSTGSTSYDADEVVGGATANKFKVTTANGTPTAGTAFNITLTAYDNYDNVATNYSASGKTFTLSGPANAPDSTAPTYPSNASIISAFSSGAATISVTLTKVETVSIDLSDGSINSTGSTAYDADEVVGHGTANKFKVTTANGTPTAGTAFNITLTAYDNYDNVATGYSASGKTFTLSGPANAPDSTAPTYPSNASIISAFSSGAATISVTLYKVETVSIDLSDGSINSTGSTAYDADEVVARTAANKLAFTTQPSSSGTAGTAISTQPVVEIRDQYSNLCNSGADATLTVALAAVNSSDGTTVLTGSLTNGSVAASGGVATFSGVKYNQAETLKLKASSGALTTDLSNAVTVNAASLTSLSMSGVGTTIATQSGSRTFNFTTVNPIAVGGKVVVTFDSDFSFSSPTVSGNTGATISAPANVATITLGTQVNASTAVSLVIGGIVNPTVPQTVSDYSIATKTSGDITIDSGTITGDSVFASFTISAPATAATWFAGKAQTITWTTTGTVATVDLFYSVETDYTSFTSIVADCAVASGQACASGNYSWTVPVGIVPSPQSDRDILVKVKVADSDAGHPAATTTTGAFTVRWHRITWIIQDPNGISLVDFNVSEAATPNNNPAKVAWTVSDNTLDSGAIRYYPDNSASGQDKYTTIFTRTDGTTPYTTSATSWDADQDEAITLILETAATASVEYKTEISAVYNSTDDSISVSSWLTQKGSQITLTNANSDISVNLYNASGTLLNTSADLGAGVTPNTQGIYSGIVYDPSGGLDPSATYTIKVIISTPASAANSAPLPANKQYTGVSGFVSPSVYTFEAKIGAIYNSTNDSIMANVWLERSGTTVTDPGDMRFIVLNGATELINIPPATTVSNLVAGSGVFTNLTYDPSGGLSSTAIYTIKANIDYRGKTYNAVASFSKGELGAISSNVDAIQAAQASQTTTLSSKIASERATVTDKITSDTATLSTKIGSVGTSVDALPTTVSSQVTTDVNAQLVKGVQAELLTRPAEVTTGTTVPIRYRTATALSPKITVYDPKGVVRVSAAAMTEISTTGIYEYKLTLSTAWGTGDFTVLVSEATRASSDSLILHVGLGSMDEIFSSVSTLGSGTFATNLDQILSSVNTIQTNTVGLNSDINSLLAKLGKSTDTAATSTLFGKIAGLDDSSTEEEILAGVTDVKNYVDSLEKALGASTDITSDTIFGRLAEMQKQLEEMGGSSKDIESAKLKAMDMSKLMEEIRADLANGNVADAAAKLASLGQGLNSLNGDLDSLPKTTGAASVGKAFDDISGMASGGGLETLVPLLQELKAGRAALNPENMTEMRNTVEELKSLMTEVRALLDKEVNQPVVHGWLEEETQ